MKAIILAAGYATRLYPLTKDFPKPLLEVNNKPILDYIVEEINTIDEVDQIYIITNNKFYNIFNEYANKKNNIKSIEVVNDGTSSNEDRLGPVGDIFYVVDKYKIEDNLLVMSGDNLFDDKLVNAYNYFKEKESTTIYGVVEEDVEKLKTLGVAILDENNKVLQLVEKPSEPISNTAIYSTYFINKKDINYFYKYKEEGYLKDVNYNFIEYLYKEEDVYAYRSNGRCYDIGTKEALDEINDMYTENK